jgi:hypothetical protein
MRVDLSPVKNDNGDVILIDIHVDGEWIGSARTEGQCDQLVRNHLITRNQAARSGRTGGRVPGRARG